MSFTLTRDEMFLSSDKTPAARVTACKPHVFLTAKPRQLRLPYFCSKSADRSGPITTFLQQFRLFVFKMDLSKPTTENMKKKNLTKANSLLRSVLGFFGMK